MPGIVANTKQLYEAGAPVVAGTDAGIAPVKPHDVVRYAPAMLRQLGFGQAEALRTITALASPACVAIAVRKVRNLGMLWADRVPVTCGAGCPHRPAKAEAG